jgi:hypothetical protein
MGASRNKCLAKFILVAVEIAIEKIFCANLAMILAIWRVIRKSNANLRQTFALTGDNLFV